MRFVIQNVSHAEVSVEEKVTGSIDQGFLVLIGVSDTDDEKIADRMVAKMLKLRIFEDENGKTNLDLNPSSPCTRTAARATGLPLSRRERRIMPRPFTNISSGNAKNPCPMYSRGSSAPICMSA